MVPRHSWKWRGAIGRRRTKAAVRALAADLLGETHGFFHGSATTFSLFAEILRTGTHADEDPPRLLAEPMRVDSEFFRNMLEDDLFAIYAYVTRVAARTGSGDKVIPDYARDCNEDADCRTGETCYANQATGANECVGAPCVADPDCDACQTCGSGVCEAPRVGNPCLAGGI